MPQHRPRTSTRSGPRAGVVGDREYTLLLNVRTELRKFEQWSAAQAEEHDLTATQHQLLLAIRGDDSPGGPTIGQVADYLLIRHHSAVERVDRAARAGLVERTRDADDHRAVRLQLTAEGERLLSALSQAHLEELTRLAGLFEALTDRLDAR